MEMEIRRVTKEEEARLAEAMDLVWRVFSRFEAPEYKPEGVENFRRYITQESLSALLENPHFQVWCAFSEGHITGVLAAACSPCHISLLFVDEQHHKQGIARSLLEEMLQHVKKHYPQESTVSVNASPYGLEAYRRLGFGDLDNEKEVDGMRFVPMLYFIK